MRELAAIIDPVRRISIRQPPSPTMSLTSVEHAIRHFILPIVSYLHSSAITARVFPATVLSKLLRDAVFTYIFFFLLSLLSSRFFFLLLILHTFYVRRENDQENEKTNVDHVFIDEGFVT